MSTVLWANHLSGGVVTSDQSDKYVLHKHLDKLDAICRELGLRPFSDICDSTDVRVNLDEISLPDGMKSTDQLMAKEGVWIEAGKAVDMLEKLLSAIRAKKTKFGLLRNDHDGVVDELEESVSFAKVAASKGAKFNFSIVM